MNEAEMRLAMLVAELDCENRMLRARNERLTGELAQVHASLAERLEAMFPKSDTVASIAIWIRGQA